MAHTGMDQDLRAVKQEHPLEGLRPAENFLEERCHRLPRPLVRQRVVGYAWHAHAVGVRIGEAVHRAAIAHDLPVRLCFGHLLCQGVDLRHWDKRIVGAGVHQDLRSDASRSARCVAWAPSLKASGITSTPGRLWELSSSNATNPRRVTLPSWYSMLCVLMLLLHSLHLILRHVVSIVSPLPSSARSCRRLLVP